MHDNSRRVVVSDILRPPRWVRTIMARLSRCDALPDTKGVLTLGPDALYCARAWLPPHFPAGRQTYCARACFCHHHVTSCVKENLGRKGFMINVLIVWLIWSHFGWDYTFNLLSMQDSDFYLFVLHVYRDSPSFHQISQCLWRLVLHGIPVLNRFPWYHNFVSC